MEQLVLCYKYVCVEFYANYKVILQYSHRNDVPFARNDPPHVNYTKMSICAHVVFNITMLKVHLFDAPFW